MFRKWIFNVWDCMNPGSCMCDNVRHLVEGATSSDSNHIKSIWQQSTSLWLNYLWSSWHYRSHLIWGGHLLALFGSALALANEKDSWDLEGEVQWGPSLGEYCGRHGRFADLSTSSKFVDIAALQPSPGSPALWMWLVEYQFSTHNPLLDVQADTCTIAFSDLRSQLSWYLSTPLALSKVMKRSFCLKGSIARMHELTTVFPIKPWQSTSSFISLSKSTIQHTHPMHMHSTCSPKHKLHIYRYKHTPHAHTHSPALLISFPRVNHY